jgi:HlyD family secretion protein/heavy metal-binding protein
MDLMPKYADEQGSAGEPSGSQQKKILYWYAPMNPAYHSDHPGKSPMGMDLVPKYAEESTETMPAGTVKITPQRQQLIGVRTTTVERAPLTRTIRTTGYLVADETKIAHIHVKVKGWVDQVYVDFIGQLVKKGQPLFTVYSPDLVSTEQDYLIALRGKAYLGNAPFREVSEGASGIAICPSIGLPLRRMEFPSKQNLSALTNAITAVLGSTYRRAKRPITPRLVRSIRSGGKRWMW